MYREFEIPVYVLKKGNFYYSAGSAVWTAVKGKAAMFDYHQAKRAKALMHNNKTISTERV